MNLLEAEKELRAAAKRLDLTLTGEASRTVLVALDLFRARIDALQTELAVARLDADEVIGYVLVGRDKRGDPEIDWDGKVHVLQGDAEYKLRAAHRAGMADYRMYALHPVKG